MQYGGYFFFKCSFLKKKIYLLYIQCSACMSACTKEEGIRTHHRWLWAISPASGYFFNKYFKAIADVLKLKLHFWHTKIKVQINFEGLYNSYSFIYYLMIAIKFTALVIVDIIFSKRRKFPKKCLLQYSSVDITVELENYSTDPFRLLRTTDIHKTLKQLWITKLLNEQSGCE